MSTALNTDAHDSPPAEAERRYGLRYRVPKENPERVVIEIAVHRVMGLS